MPEQLYKSFDLFDYRLDSASPKVTLRFTQKNSIQTFVWWDFYSRILHSLIPSPTERIWTEGKRLNVHIKGWPREVKFDRTGDFEITGTFKDNWTIKEKKSYLDDLHGCLKNVSKGTLYNGVKVKQFYIGRNDEWEKYNFASASREVAGLCMLYDLAKKTRTHIELWLSPESYPKLERSPHNNWPVSVTEEKKYFGDPSKVVESMEKMGWSRYGDSPTSITGRVEYEGNRQEVYRITTVNQDLSEMKIRTEISKEWRIAILERDNFTCLYCGREEVPDLLNRRTGKHPNLDPDHRIPVNVESDNLNDDNYLDKIITLCSTCNQRKREVTKKLQQQPEHDWENEEWAYPDRSDFVERRIKSLIKKLGESTGKSPDMIAKDIVKI